jgi:hypothetical protein
MFLHLSDFGSLAKRYEAVRNAKLEELKQKYPFAGRDEEERRQNVTDTREFRKFVRRLRERRRKEGRVRQIARQMTKSPAVIITEELGKNPQEEMIGLEKKAEYPRRGRADSAKHANRRCPSRTRSGLDTPCYCDKTTRRLLLNQPPLPYPQQLSLTF